MDNRWLRPRLVVGLFVIAFGVVLGLDELDYLDSSQFLRWWPLLLIALGALRWMRGERGRLLAVLLMVAGTWFLVINLGFVNADYFDLWPLFLVIVGAALIYSSVRNADRGLAPSGDGSVVSESAVFAGKKLASASQHFRGGNLTAAMGSCEMDLRGARLDGEEAVLDCVAFWGGVEILVPREWRVVSDVIPILGGVENGSEPPAEEDAPRLRLTGYAVMGGIEVGHGKRAKTVKHLGLDEQEEGGSRAVFHVEVGRGGGEKAE